MKHHLSEMIGTRFLIAFLLLILLNGCAVIRGTGDLGIIIERASGSIQIIETTGMSSLGRINGLGDLSHASVVYSRDERYAYIFGRDGGLTKVDLLQKRISKRIIQSGNSIGGAISQDGRLVAVSNYKPGGVRVFDAKNLEPVANIPAKYDAQGTLSKVVGLVDAPGQKFVFSLYDAGEIWVADFSEQPHSPKLDRHMNVGLQPYDAFITPDGRYYLAGLFGEDGLAWLDLWQENAEVKRVLDGYGRGEEKLPVYKMPHLEGWAIAGNFAFVPAVGRHEVLVIDQSSWKQHARISVHGQPVFVMAQPGGRYVWVNFAFPKNDIIQVIDTATFEVAQQFKPGPGILHMEFTPRGEQVWISVRDEDRVDIYDTRTFTRVSSLPAKKPSGIFLTSRAHKIGL